MTTPTSCVKFVTSVLPTSGRSLSLENATIDTSAMYSAMKADAIAVRIADSERRHGPSGSCASSSMPMNATSAVRPAARPSGALLFMVRIAATAITLIAMVATTIVRTIGRIDGLTFHLQLA